MAGLLITFEGCEGCGKSTQIAHIYKWMLGKGLPVQITREPGGTAVGEGIRDLLLGSQSMSPTAELLLYAADRVQHIEDVIKPWLAQGNIVLCDRFTDSTVAYQAFGRGLPLGEVNKLNLLSTGGLTPDLTLWLDMEPEQSLARCGDAPDRLERESLEFHNKVRQGYEFLYRYNPNRIHWVDAAMPEDEVLGVIVEALEGFGVLNYSRTRIEALHAETLAR